MSFAQEALINARNAGYQKGEIIALINKSEIYRELGNYKEAMAQADLVKKYAEKLTDNELLAKYEILYGYSYHSRHKYNIAIEHYKKAFSLFKASGDLIGMGDAQRRMAHSFSAVKDYDIMHDFFESALKYYQQARYQRGIAAIMNNLGQYYLYSIKDYKKAEAYLYKAINLNLKDGNILWLSKNYANLSEVKEGINQQDSVIYYDNAALNLARKVGNPYWESITLMRIAYLNKQKGNEREALNYYYEAFQLSKEINSFENLTDIADSLNEIYYQKGIIDSAYLYQKIHFEYADSLIQNNSNLKFMELRYQTETELNQQKVVLENQKRFYLFLMVSICLILVIIILFLLYTRQKIKVRNTLLEKERLSDKIEFKNKELTNNILISQKKSELINTIIKDIEDNKDLFPKESHNKINQIIHNLSTTVEEKGWEEFELIFRQVHESFFIKLDLLFPDLTTKERRLCALLRLNMSSKEIAEATQLTSRSVDTARYRLRKRLGIENPDIDLITFLRKL